MPQQIRGDTIIRSYCPAIKFMIPCKHALSLALIWEQLPFGDQHSIARLLVGTLNNMQSNFDCQWQM